MTPAEQAAATLAEILARPRMHRVRRLGEEHLAKRRRVGLRTLIPAGNLLVRWRPVPVRMLDDAAWTRRERSMYRALERRPVEKHGRWLRLPAAPGAPLAEHLRSSSSGASKKLGALRAASVALRDLHDLTIDGRACSHGDATASNVLWDEASALASWIDFDVEHLPSLDATARAADDLRALCFSAAAGSRGLEVKTIVDTVLDGYGVGDACRAELRRHVADRRLEHDLWHLAQSLGSGSRREGCREALR